MLEEKCDKAAKVRDDKKKGRADMNKILDGKRKEERDKF